MASGRMIMIVVPVYIESNPVPQIPTHAGKQGLSRAKAHWAFLHERDESGVYRRLTLVSDQLP